DWREKLGRFGTAEAGLRPDPAPTGRSEGRTRAPLGFARRAAQPRILRRAGAGSGAGHAGCIGAYANLARPRSLAARRRHRTAGFARGRSARNAMRRSLV